MSIRYAKMNLYEYIYLGIYRSIFRTNKSIPEYSTLFCLSSIMSCNLVSLSILLNIDLKRLEEKHVFLIFIALYGVHYLYFQRGKRIIKKIETLSTRAKTFSNVLTILYAFASISFFCFLVNLQLKNYLMIIIGIALVFSLGHFSSNKGNKKLD